jgi:hypothetical protein
MALDATTAAHFVPLSIIKPDAGVEREIVLTNACMVRLKGLIDPLLLQAAITAAGPLDGSRRVDRGAPGALPPIPSR